MRWLSFTFFFYDGSGGVGDFDRDGKYLKCLAAAAVSDIFISDSKKVNVIELSCV